MSLQIIQPVAISSSILSTNVVDTTSGWVNGNSYSAGQRVARGYSPPKDPNGNQAAAAIFQCVSPVTSSTFPENDPDHWVFVSVTNPYLMFDTVNATQSTAANQINLTLSGITANKLALFNLDAVSVQVIVTYFSVVVFDVTYSLQSPPLLANWYNYLYDDIVYAKEFVIDLPIYRGCNLTVKINKSGGTAACGTMIVGKSSVIADGIQYGATTGITDYSRKEKDTFGAYKFIQRAYSKRAEISCWLDRGSVDAVQQFLALLRGVPTLYIGDDGYTSTAIYGYYKDFNITISNPTQSLCTLSLEGLT